MSIVAALFASLFVGTAVSLMVAHRALSDSRVNTSLSGTLFF